MKPPPSLARLGVSGSEKPAKVRSLRDAEEEERRTTNEAENNRRKQAVVGCGSSARASCVFVRRAAGRRERRRMRGICGSSRLQSESSTRRGA